MKPNTSSFPPGFIRILVLLGGLASLCIAFAQSDKENRREALVIAVYGKGTYSVGSVQEGKLRPGLSLPEGTRITTGKDSKADLYFRQIGSIFRLMPESNVTLEKLTKRQQNGKVVKETVVKLEKGRLLTKARVLLPESRFEIRTAETIFIVPQVGNGRYEVRADGSVIVGKKSSLPIAAVVTEEQTTNIVSPSQMFDPDQQHPVKANEEVLNALTQEMDELQELAERLTPPPTPEELPK